MPHLTVAICCFNSAKRLPDTLRHLAAQNGVPADAWEVLIIDNASTDETSMVAKQSWKAAITEMATTVADTGTKSQEKARLHIQPVSFRIIREEAPGLSEARKRAFAEARGEIVCFLDDDNWAPPHWLAKVREIFDANPEVAGLGGPISEVLEAEPPEWWEQYKGNFTIWNPRDTAGTWERPLCGAGLCIRKRAWEQLRASGFEFQLSDRKGKNLSSGGDFELCYALFLAGWKLWYDPALHIRHFMPKERLTWENLVRLNRSFGEQSVVLDAYAAALKGKTLKPWWREYFFAVAYVLRQRVAKKKLKEACTFEHLLAASQAGRASALWREQSAYKARALQINASGWIKQ